MPVRYRVEQFLRARKALSAEQVISDHTGEHLARVLSPAAQALFARQAPQDQRHALAVYETLCRRGYTCKDLLAAALLHDVGKAVVRLRPWQRGVFVLAERLAPGALEHVTRGRTQGLWRSFALYARHAEIGARWAEHVGCSPVTVELIGRHEEQLATCQTPVVSQACGERSRTIEPQEDRLLAALQAADDVN